MSVPAGTEGEPRRFVAGRIRFQNALAALRHRNFRLFFLGSALSLIGTWMQTVAEGWLVYELTGDPLALGFIRFLHTVPVTGLTLVGGALADRMDKRRILLRTQTGSMFLALALFGLVVSGKVEVWHIAVIGLGLGLAHSFDIPARQAFLIEMVGKKDLMNAIALNSSMFNGARIVGPSIAGLLTGAAGWLGLTAMGALAGCFLFNGISFLGVIVAYLAMKLPKREVTSKSKPIGQATREAIRYVLSHRELRSILFLVTIVSLFGWPYSVLMPIYAGDVFGLKATGYSYLMAANGVGAFLGALSLTTLGDYPNKHRLLAGGFGVFCLGLLILAQVSDGITAGFVLALIGWAMIFFFATANTIVQINVADDLRGRVMGIYSFCFLGISPFGSLLAGWAAKVWSAPLTVGIGAGICAVAGLLVFGRQWLSPQLRG